MNTSEDDDEENVQWEDGAVAKADVDEEEEAFAYSDVDEENVDWEDVAEAPSQPTDTHQQQQSLHNTEPPAQVRQAEDSDDGEEGFDDDDDDTYDYEEDAAAMDEDDSDDNGEQTAQEMTDLQKVDWDQVNQVLQREAARATKKRKIQRMSKADKARELVLHQSHLLLLLATQLKWNALCQSPVLRGLLLSLTSDSSFDFYVEMKRQPMKYSLELLVRWFREHFRVVSASDPAADGGDDDNDDRRGGELLTEAKLIRVFFARKGAEYELAVLFTALCRALRLRCRHTSALDALLVQQSKAFESSSSSSSRSPHRRQQTRKRSRLNVTTTEEDAAAESRDDSYIETVSAQNFWIWSEVYDEKKKSWIHVDAIRRIVGHPHETESLRGKGAPFSYIVGISDTERLIDVTPRYAARWSKSLALRIADKWMQQTIEAMSAAVSNGTRWKHDATSLGDHTFGEEDEEQLFAAEQSKLLAMTESEEMPTSVEGFKKHHLYCLERHLGQYECMYPRKAVGIFKGQPVFLRKHVQVTRSAYQWLRLGRVVKASEREKPAKWYTKSKNGKASAQDSDDENDGDDSMGSNANGARAMFGVWQTNEFVSPPVVDGIVPKNSYGNIELWSKSHVPRHAVHVRLPRIEKVAQQLGIDFAQAVVGFEVKNGRNVPKFDGIVVAESSLEMLVDAHAHVQQNTIEKAIEKNQQLIARRWERIVRRLLLRQRLEDDYGTIGSSSK